MKALVAQLAVLAVALLTAGLSVHFGDGSALVPPPEAEAEDFMRSIAAGRYEPARKRMSDDARHTVDLPALADLRRRLEQKIGTVQQIEGVRSHIRGEDAVADVLVTPARGPSRELQVPLVRRHRSWFVARLPGRLTTKEDL